MRLRKPRSMTPFSMGMAILLGAFGGVYIWGPSLQHYLNTDPEMLAYRKKAQLERELEKQLKK